MVIPSGYGQPNGYLPAGTFGSTGQTPYWWQMAGAPPGATGLAGGQMGGGAGGNVNMIGTGVMDSAFPWATYPSSLAADLAGTAFGTLGNIYSQNIASNASMANAATSAAAQLGSAGISAQGGIDQQLISTNGMLKATQAQIQADLVKAAQGDIAAMQRLKQAQALEAQLANNAQKLEVAKLMGSGSLFDNVAARFAVSGMGAIPQMGSAFKNGGLQNVTVPNYSSPSVADYMKYMPNVGSVSAPGGGGGYTSGITMPSFSGGGGGGGFGGLNMGNIFTDILGSVNAGLPQTFQQTGQTPTPAPTVGPAQNIINNASAGGTTMGIDMAPQLSLAAKAAGNNALSDAILNWGAGMGPQPKLSDLTSLKGMNAGGRLRPGQSAIVGDAPGGRLTPFSEVVTARKGGVEVTPIKGAYHAGTGPHTHTGTDGPIGGVYQSDGDQIGSIYTSGFTGGPAPGATTTPTTTTGNIFPTTKPKQTLGGFAAPKKKPVSTTPAEPEVPAAVPDPVAPPPEPAPLPGDTTGNGTSVPLGNVGDDGSGNRTDGGANGVLSEFNNLPALMQLRNRNPLGSIYSLPELSRPELGIDALPSPFSVGQTFRQMNSADQSNAMQMYQLLFGITPEDFQTMVNSSQPGYRRFGLGALRF